MSQSSSPQDTFPFGQQKVWEPNPTWIDQSNLTGFMKKHGIDSYDALFEKSISDVAWFWDAVIKDLNIEFYKDYTSVVDMNPGVEFPIWCPGADMNIVHNCLDKWQDSNHRNRLALRWEGEEGTVHQMSYAELYREVNRCANMLRGFGLGKGDAIGLFMPMIPELAVAFLAAIKIGGIILPLFSGYGAGAVTTRLRDAGAKALITADGFFRRGKRIRMKPTADEAANQVHTLEHVVVVDRTGSDDTPWNKQRDSWWHEAMENQSDEAATTRTSAEDIMMIIYTSGTTGRPKGAVHTHCGFPIKSAQDMYHPMDLKPDNTMYWMTDMGWMMGPWEVFGSLIIGASMVFYDGAPDFPDVDRLWKIVSDHEVTHLGVSPTLIRALSAHGKEPVTKHDISGLRMVGSTGSPWDPESWMWLFNTVLDAKKPILNYSGGTEISGGIVCGNFFEPLKPCAFSGPVVGMDADVIDENGDPLRGAVGELIIRKPWIGMTRGFWQDKERYLDSYWRRMPGTWLHGDFAAVDEDGLWYILGRSDDTIKIAGKRLGPAEVEAIVNGHDEVLESAAIAIPHPIKDNEVVVFCVLKSGANPSDELRAELMQLITEELGKPLKPKEIRFSNALPKTRNAKVMRRVIRAAYLGEDPGDVSSLEDPFTVDSIKNST